MTVRTALEIVRRPELRPYVRRLIVDVPSGDTCAVATTAPSGYASLGWVVSGKLRASVSSRAHATISAPDGFVGGPRCDEETRLAFSGRFAQVVVEFSATGLFELLGIDGAAVAGDTLPIRSLERERLAPFLELIAARGLVEPSEVAVRECCEALQDVLCELVGDTRRAPMPVGRAAAALERTHGLAKILDVADEIGMSASQLRKQFRLVVGLPPKAFARVLMFNRAMELLVRARSSGRRCSLTELAIDAGYYDQAHFSNSLKRLVGRNPSRYLRESVAFPDESCRRDPG